MHICARICYSLRITGVPELCTTCMQPHANIPTKYLPHALPFIHLGGLPEASDKLGTLFPESGPPGTPGSCASYVGTTSLLFRDILPTWVLRARQTAKPGHFRSDMTFRQAMEHSGDSSKTVSFLTLWDDVIGVSWGCHQTPNSTSINGPSQVVGVVPRVYVCSLDESHAVPLLFFIW